MSDLLGALTLAAFAVKLWQSAPSPRRLSTHPDVRNYRLQLSTKPTEMLDLDRYS